MGYKPTDKKEGQDLVYEGEVKLPGVLETATDLLVMHEEICLLQDMVQSLVKEKRDAGVQLEVLVTFRQKSKSYEEAWAAVMGSQTSDGSENQTYYANLPLKAAVHEQFHAPNAPHPLPSTSSPHVYSQPGNMMASTQQSTNSQYYNYLPPSTGNGQQQCIPHGVGGVPMTQGTAPQYGAPNSQNAGQYQSNFAPSHTTSQGYHYPPPNDNQSYVTTHVSQPRQQVAVSHHQSGPGPAVSQYHPGPGPVVSQYEPDPRPAVSQYPPGPGPAVSGPGPAVPQYPPGPRPAVSQYHSGPRPDVAQYQSDPGPAVSQHQSGLGPAGQGRDGTQASNPTQYQNYPQTDNESVTHQTRADHLGHNENVDPELNILAHKQHMGSYNMPASTSQEDQQSLNETNDSINPDNLPPPIMNFSHMGSTPVTPYNEVLESGLVMSGIVGTRDGLSLLPPSESGPLGMQISESGEHSPNPTYDHSISNSSGDHSPNDHSLNKSSSSESVDLYGSGPVKQYKYQRSSSSSVPPLPEEARIEGSWVVIEKGGQDDIPSSPSTPKSQPALVTQGSQDTEPRELDSELNKPIPKPRRLPDKTQSVDVVEDQKRGEKVHPVMRSCVSGSSLLDSQHIPDQSNSTTLDKPTPRPRSRSPSPAASSNENSPSASPTPQYRNVQILPGRPPGQRPTHEMWSPTGSSKQLKSSTLPRQTQSVDRESEDKREMTHFSSGSNIHGGEGLHLPLKTSPAQNTMEPETPVKGIPIQPVLRRVQNASSTSKLTSHGRGKESMPPISQNPPTQPLSAQPTDSHPLLPQTDHMSTPNVPSSQSSAPYSPSEEPRGSHPVRETISHSGSSVLPVPSNQSSALYSPSEKPPHPVTDTSHPISPPVKETSHSRSSVLPVLSSQSSAPSEEPRGPQPVKDSTSSPVKETSHSRSSVFPAPATKSPAGVGTTKAKAGLVATSKPDESRLDRGGESAHILRKTIDQDRNPEESTMRGRANALSQKHGNVGKKELVTEDAMTDRITDKKGLDDSTTELEQKFGISLTGTWICEYCTNMVQESLLRCDVCNKHRYESVV